MDREEYVELYDIYKELFTSKQQEYFEDYYFEDLSLSEMSENYNVSRSIISKTINKVEQKLIEYEQKLKINKKNKEVKSLLKDYPSLLKSYEEL